MLDRAKVMQELQGITAHLFFDTSDEMACARREWAKISADSAFCYKARAAQTPWFVPSWQGNLNHAKPVNAIKEPYCALSVDGSQIYPDRHQGTSCFLINIGSVLIPYNIPDAKVFFATQPSVYLPTKEDAFESSVELVNCKRQELEFQEGLRLSTYSEQIISAGERAFFFDGSLIFWHLDAKDPQLRDAFLASYLRLLQEYCNAQILIAGYISLPKSKELVNLVRLSLCNFDINNEAYKAIDHLVDSHIAQLFLQPFERSIVFKNHSPISESYPESLHPHFFYMHVGDEIARIEIPAYVANDEQKVDCIARILRDQCTKGYGYPVCIAEAHEQAVVKGPDRDFFYHLIQRVGFTTGKRIAHSQKSLKKRALGI